MATVTFRLQGGDRDRDVDPDRDDLVDVYLVRVSGLLSSEDPRAEIYDEASDRGDGESIQRGAAHPVFAGLTCRSVGIAPIAGSSTVFEYRAAYALPDPSNPGDDPTAADPVIRWEEKRFEEALDTALNVVDYDPSPGPDGTTTTTADAPIATTAGEPIVGLIRPVSLPMLVVTLNYGATVVDAAFCSSWANRVNSDVWTYQTGKSAAAGTVLIDGAPQAEYVKAADPVPAYWRVTWRFVFREHPDADPYMIGAASNDGRAWWSRVLNQGFRYVDDSGPPPVTKVFRDANGTPLNRPRLLDLDGAATTDAYWRWFQTYKTKAFSTLTGFPLSI